MAKQDFETLIVALEANLKSYEKELAKAQKITVTKLRGIERDMQTSATKMEKTFDKLSSGLSGFAKGFGIGIALSAVAAIGELAKGSVAAAANIGDLSDKLGITSDKLQELQFGAVQANMDFGELEKGLLKFSKSLGQARNGQGDLLKTLRANGFTEAQVKAMSYSEALDTVADLVKNAANEQDAFLIITQAFGKGGDAFLELLRGGSTALKDFAVDAHKASTIIDEELIKSAQRFDDMLSRWSLKAKSATSEFVLTTIDGYQKLWSGYRDWFNSNIAPLGIPGMGFEPTSSSLRSRSPAVSPTTQSGSGKGDRFTKIFNPEDEAAAKAIREERERALRKQKEAIEKVITALKLEGETLGQSNLQQEIATALSRADVTAKSLQGQEIIKLVTANEMQKASIASVQFVAEEAARKQEEFTNSMTELSRMGVEAFSAWAIEGEKLDDVMNNLAKSLLQSAINAALFGEGPMAGLLGGASGGGFFGQLFKSPGLYAKGGTIGAGELGIAGEGGNPELIKGPATVIPFSKLGSNNQQPVQIIDQRTNAPPIQQERNSDGQMRFFIRDMVIKTIGSGDADKALRVRHNLNPSQTRRG